MRISMGSSLAIGCQALGMIDSLKTSRNATSSASHRRTRVGELARRPGRSPVACPHGLMWRAPLLTQHAHDRVSARTHAHSEVLWQRERWRIYLVGRGGAGVCVRRRATLTDHP